MKNISVQVHRHEYPWTTHPMCEVEQSTLSIPMNWEAG